VAAPASSTRRVVKNITIYNKDTAAVTITVSFNANSTLRNIAKVTLAVGDTWTPDGAYDTNGSLKTDAWHGKPVYGCYWHVGGGKRRHRCYD
jgi:hypothetical protein